MSRDRWQDVSEAFGNQWKPMEINGNFWKLKEMSGHGRKSLEMIGHRRKWTEMSGNLARGNYELGKLLVSTLGSPGSPSWDITDWHHGCALACFPGKSCRLGKRTPRRFLNGHADIIFGEPPVASWVSSMASFQKFKTQRIDCGELESIISQEKI